MVMLSEFIHQDISTLLSFLLRTLQRIAMVSYCITIVIHKPRDLTKRTHFLSIELLSPSWAACLERYIRQHDWINMSILGVNFPASPENT